jgi:cytochrome c peroxidase
LRAAKIPKVPGLNRIVKSKHWAEVLGKAFFWDQALGSDGIACASCHYHAGSDNRTINQLGIAPELGAQGFDVTATGGGGVNYSLRGEDFPFYKLADPNDRKSQLIHHNKNVGGSAGAFRSDFVAVPPQSQVIDDFAPVADPVWNEDHVTLINGMPQVVQLNTRRVTGRNAPTAINAVFNFRNFWDGRANNEFNGQDNWGPRNPNAYVLTWDGQEVDQERLRLKNASLASQAVGPPNSDIEMACRGRVFEDIAEKLLPRQPLAYQYIAADDSLLGPYVQPGGVGLVTTYEDLIRNAFHEEYWGAPDTATSAAGESDQMVHNFAMYFGLAVMAYESTLVSDDTRYDDFAEGSISALSSSELNGLNIFLGKGKCVNCHKGPDFTGAGYVLQKERNESGLVERMRMEKKFIAQYDNGFYNIAVDPTSFDLGIGYNDPWGNPLSWTRQWLDYLNGGSTPVDSFQVDPATYEEVLPTNDPFAYAGDRDAVDGAFKTSGLRNIELTGPYMHNGSMSTLEQVVEFYNRGGNYVGNGQSDTTGYGPNPSNLDADIRKLDLTVQEQADLVAFMKALTDERVRNEQAPFDHPSLIIPHGHNQPGWFYDLGPLYSTDNIRVLPAVGQGGRQALGLSPLQPFERGLR